MVRVFFVLCMLIAMPTAGCMDRNEQPGAQTAPDFTLQDLNGNTVSLSDFKGKVVLLEFWTTWCPSCRAAIPGLEKLHRSYKDKGLVVLSVSMDFGGWEELKSFIAQRGITYMVLKGNDEVAAQYKLRTIPLLLIVNKEGGVAKRYLGIGSVDEMEKDIQAYL